MALTNQFWKSSTSTTPNKRVQISKVLSFEKLTIVDTNNAANNKIGILFDMDTLNAAPKSIQILFPGSVSDATTLRDASIAALDALVTQGTV